MVRVVPLRSDKQLQHLIFLAGQVHALAIHFHRLGVEIDGELAGGDHRLAVALGAAHHGLDAGDQLVLVEGLGHVIVGAEAQGLDLGLDDGVAGQDQDGGLHLGDAQRLQHFEARHVGQLQVENDNVVVIKLTQIDPFFAEIGGVDVQGLRCAASARYCAPWRCRLQSGVRACRGPSSVPRSRPVPPARLIGFQTVSGKWLTALFNAPHPSVRRNPGLTDQYLPQGPIMP